MLFFRKPGDFLAYLVEVVFGYALGYGMFYDSKYSLVVAADVTYVWAEGCWGEVATGY